MCPAGQDRAKKRVAAVIFTSLFGACIYGALSGRPLHLREEHGLVCYVLYDVRRVSLKIHWYY